MGFLGQHRQRHWQTDYDALVLTKRDFREFLGVADHTAAECCHASFRQVVETANGFLDKFLGLKFPNGKTYWRRITRLAAKHLKGARAANLTRYLNHIYPRPPFAYFDPLG